jgi:hypothetical protein
MSTPEKPKVSKAVLSLSNGTTITIEDTKHLNKIPSFGNVLSEYGIIQEEIKRDQDRADLFAFAKSKGYDIDTISALAEKLSKREVKYKLDANGNRIKADRAEILTEDQKVKIKEMFEQNAEKHSTVSKLRFSIHQKLGFTEAQVNKYTAKRFCKQPVGIKLRNKG